VSAADRLCRSAADGSASGGRASVRLEVGADDTHLLKDPAARGTRSPAARASPSPYGRAGAVTTRRTFPAAHRGDSQLQPQFRRDASHSPGARASLPGTRVALPPARAGHQDAPHHFPSTRAPHIQSIDSTSFSACDVSRSQQVAAHRFRGSVFAVGGKCGSTWVDVRWRSGGRATANVCTHFGEGVSVRQQMTRCAASRRHRARPRRT